MPIPCPFTYYVSVMQHPAALSLLRIVLAMLLCVYVFSYETENSHFKICEDLC